MVHALGSIKRILEKELDKDTEIALLAEANAINILERLEKQLDHKTDAQKARESLNREV